MKKTTKSAIAASAAAVLLLGGAGTLAYWSATETVEAGTLSSGSITLGSVECGDDWVHIEDDSPVALLVPGDEIALECEVELTLTGDHIGATLEVDEVSATGPLASALDFSDVTLSGTGVTNDQVEGAGTYTVTATVTAEFPYGTAADNTTQGISAEALGDLELVAVQTHVTP